MVVLKFGGTSVGNAERIKNLLSLLPNKKCIVVLSAVSGTTNRLIKLSNFLKDDLKNDFAIELIEFQSFYHALINDLFKTDQFKQLAFEMIEMHISQLNKWKSGLYSKRRENEIVSRGELISTSLFHLHLSEKNIPSNLISALDFMRLNEDEEPDIIYIGQEIKKVLKEDVQINITQGYICRDKFGNISNLKRGGSDYSASLIGEAINAEEIQIWTDIDGMHNNDPRIVDNTSPISSMSFDEAAELAYFGAKILHPQSIGPAQRANIPVKLLNTMMPEKGGTLISLGENQNRFLAIAAKDDITSIRIKSTRMLMAYGFLRRIFEVFERYKTPIDLITTSEVAVSVTIDNKQYLKEIIEELSQFGLVESKSDNSIICIVGKFEGDHPGYANQVFKALKDIPIRMISYGGSRHNITLLVNSVNKKPALTSLHSSLFTDN
ncbi:MAG: aspartate kinase [Sphingobacteriales bacterium]|jgi:aspartate kinase